ncbi:superoxide dismutase [Frankia sp. CcI156]|uniref:Superoxide dismutase, copper/zinc binding n=1 Tax=Frankia casuarinae (strain DSM 45818 / CECT 9043 / HFP020203 / CcI3) TaxID=106370 RepID=Q2J908_FRACC|nr:MULTISPECIES: superoxide dismutase family protein [Frankia]ABD12234.1 superoxide dismutase, copper/zinc binding [Frankia casuarinae]ETA01653.1 hypothetical protein CcI6DRAFT_02832 [Frankia sp. CcI6]EYT91754.1 hypothetical protein ThrDRAFT_02642 [Frankia casuarinae]KDA42360.1 hypothetical protein BMG523Draft_02750 [Frankia sp. BMG5.23]KFB03904.1 Cu/Zn superoxide dismutase [Frankia sp. Allo2]
MRRRLSITLAGLGLFTALFAAAASAVAPAAPSATRVVAEPVAFTTWNEKQPPAAVTYDRHLVPVGAGAVVLAAGGPRTVVGLVVQGLLPGHRYGAHVHQKACGATGTAAGPHYQNVPDPVQPSVDPAYANPHNEVWLDFSTDADGNGQAFAVVDWNFRAGGARAVVLHEHGTSGMPGEAGSAGPRAACITVPFS